MSFENPTQPIQEEITMSAEQEGQAEIETSVGFFHHCAAEVERIFGCTSINEAIERETNFLTVAVEARKNAKPSLDMMTNTLNGLNKGEDKSLRKWNPEGDLSEEQFNDLNLKRKQLANLLGALNANYPNGIRHDIHEIL